MEKFTFKFAAVLKLRKTNEDEALKSFALAQKAYQMEILKKNNLISILNQALVRKEQLGSSPVFAQAFGAEYDFILGTKQRILNADQAILRARKNLDRTLRNYLFAKKQTKVIEKLHDKALEVYKKQRSKYEQKQQDEMAILRSRLNSEEDE